MTAVEWFKNELIKRFKRSQSHQTDSEWSFDMIKKVSEQALEMEKEQSEKLKNSILELYDMVHNSNSTQDKIKANEIFSEIFKNNL